MSAWFLDGELSTCFHYTSFLKINLETIFIPIILPLYSILLGTHNALNYAGIIS